MKSPEMENATDEMALHFFGRSKSECLAAHICVMCGDQAMHFRNRLSQKEYEIRGMCQRCQDDIFSDGE